MSELWFDKRLFVTRERRLKMARDAAGMHGNRSRNSDGELRRKRGDTYVGTIEQMYRRDFDVRSDMHLGTLLKRKGVTSLNDLIHDE
jgi:hypothetical protein